MSSVSPPSPPSSSSVDRLIQLTLGALGVITAIRIVDIAIRTYNKRNKRPKEPIRPHHGKGLVSQSKLDDLCTLTMNSAIIGYGWIALPRSSKREMQFLYAATTVYATKAALMVMRWSRVHRCEQRSSHNSPLGAATSTAQGTSLNRYIIPEWRTPGVQSIGANGEKFGFDQYAKYLLNEDQLALLNHPGYDVMRDRFEKSMPGLSRFIWTRSRAIDSQLYEIVTKSRPDIQQLMIVGAGYDTRAYRFRKILDEKGVKRFEGDLPNIQSLKKASMKVVEDGEGGDIGLKDVTFIPLDLTRPVDELLTLVASNGWTIGAPTLFVMEGVTTYLEQSAVEESFKFMAQSCGAGSQLLVTFVSPAQMSMDSYEVLKKDLAKKSEPHKFYPTAELFTEILNRTGWDVRRMLTPSILCEEYSTPDEGAIFAPGHLVFATRREKAPPRA